MPVCQRDRPVQAGLKDDQILHPRLAGDGTVDAGVGIGRLDRVSQRDAFGSAGVERIRQAGDGNRRQQDSRFEFLRDEPGEFGGRRYGDTPMRRPPAADLAFEPADPQEPIQNPVFSWAENHSWP